MPEPVRSALVLAAGLGTRLHPLTTVRAKPAVPVAGEPLVRRVVRWLTAHDASNIVVNLHHLPETIARVLGDGSDVGARVRYSWEQPAILGSAGGPRLALPLIGDDTFFIVNGDTLTDLDLSALGAAHRSSGAVVTLALTARRAPHRYGGVVVDTVGVRGFVPRGSTAPGAFHFIGVQAVSAAAFRGVPAGRAASTVGGEYERLIAAAPGAVQGFICDASFWDVGTVADYVATCRSFGSSPSDPIVWDDVDVGAGAELRDCIVTDGACVPAGSAFDHAILMRGTDGKLVSLPWTNGRD